MEHIIEEILEWCNYDKDTVDEVIRRLENLEWYEEDE